MSPGGKSKSVDAQARQLTKAGCRKVFREVHVSGAKTDRAQLRRVIETLEPGDVLMVTRSSRLASALRIKTGVILPRPLRVAMIDKPSTPPGSMR